MQSTAKKATDDPHDFVVVPSDQVQVAPSDAEAAPSDAEITGLLRAAARHRSESGTGGTSDRSDSAPVPAVDTTFRATAVNDEVRPRGTSFARQAMRGLVALLVAIGIGAAALTWQTFGYTAKKAVLKWMPKMALSASLPLDKLGLGAGSVPASEPAVADATPDQAASSAQSTPATPENSAPEKATANPTASSSDPAQLQSMARDLANLGQEVEILKATISELKANQQKLSDRTSEQNARAKMVTASPRPPAIVAARKPAPVYSPTATSSAPPSTYRSTPSYSQTTQAAVPQPVPPLAAQPYVPPPPPPPATPLQSQVEPGFTAPRPPMPVQQP
jgi:hypothetical protein